MHEFANGVVRRGRGPSGIRLLRRRLRKLSPTPQAPAGAKGIGCAAGRAPECRWLVICGHRAVLLTRGCWWRHFPCPGSHRPIYAEEVGLDGFANGFVRGGPPGALRFFSVNRPDRRLLSGLTRPPPVERARHQIVERGVWPAFEHASNECANRVVRRSERRWGSPEFLFIEDRPKPSPLARLHRCPATDPPVGPRLRVTRRRVCVEQLLRKCPHFVVYAEARLGWRRNRR